MPVPLISYLLPSGELTHGFQPSMPTELVIKGYRTMKLTRHLDERMITLQRQGTITFALSALGEEACAVGSAAALELSDWLYPQYREAGILFWRGCTPLQYVHHMFGDKEDWNYGRQMPNHFGSRELNVVTVSSPIGTKIPHAAGCAYAMKLQREPNVAVCYFGEGASSEGDFHTGLNFAAVRRAPVIFFCRNNCYAISTPASKQFMSDGVAGQALGYGMITYRVDGNDFFAIQDTVRLARTQCLEGTGPIFIEAMTYRMGAHSTADDPSLYRSDAELASWKERCPILRLRRYLEREQLWNPKKEEECTEEIANEVSQAIAIAKETPRASLSYLVEHVYFELPLKLKQQYSAVRDLFGEDPACQK